jgi:hypothetical protein
MRRYPRHPDLQGPAGGWLGLGRVWVGTGRSAVCLRQHPEAAPL